MAEFMRKDIDPLEKLVYFKTRLYCTENEEALGYKSTASIQLEILLDCLDIIERISISGNDNNLSEDEKNYDLEDLIHMIPNKKRKGNFSEKLILRLIYLIKDECTSLRLKGPILNFEEEFSIENYDKLMYNDRTLKRIFDELVADLNKKGDDKGTAYGQKVLGKQGFSMYKRLRSKYNSPTEAMRKFIKNDGSRRTIDQLMAIYKKKQ